MAETTVNKWWWLPGALMAIAGLVFIMLAGVFDWEVIWVPLGAGFIAAAAFSIHRSRPRETT